MGPGNNVFPLAMITFAPIELSRILMCCFQVLDPEEVLGRGVQGVVVKALHRGTPVAVKRFSNSMSSAFSDSSPQTRPLDVPSASTSNGCPYNKLTCGLGCLKVAGEKKKALAKLKSHLRQLVTVSELFFMNHH
jgi:hypothetical protein